MDYCGDNPANWTAYSLRLLPNGLNGLFYLNDGYSDCVNGADELNATPTSNCGDDNSTLSSCEQCAESGGFYCGDDESNWTQYSPNGCVIPTWINDGYSDCVDGADELNATPTTNCGDNNDQACDDENACNYGEEEACIYPQSGLDCTGSQVITGCTDETAFNYNENATSLPYGLIVPGGSCNLEIWDGNYFGIDPDWYFDGNQNTFATGNKLYIGGNTFYVEYVSEIQGNCNAPAVLVYVVTNPDGTSDGPVFVVAVFF